MCDAELVEYKIISIRTILLETEHRTRRISSPHRDGLEPGIEEEKAGVPRQDTLCLYSKCLERITL
jgi:hypothetical protein